MDTNKLKNYLTCFGLMFAITGTAHSLHAATGCQLFVHMQLILLDRGVEYTDANGTARNRPVGMGTTFVACVKPGTPISILAYGLLGGMGAYTNIISSMPNTNSVLTCDGYECWSDGSSPCTVCKGDEHSYQ